VLLSFFSKNLPNQILLEQGGRAWVQTPQEIHSEKGHREGIKTVSAVCFDVKAYPMGILKDER